MTLGHEIVGRIKHVPEGSSLKIGDPVVVNPATFCKTCDRCKDHGTAACRKVGSMGLSGGYGGMHGGLSELVAVDVRKCYKLPDTLPLDQAALIEPMCVAWHAMKTPGFESYEGKSVLVIGSGPVGLYLLYALRNRGAKQIIVSEPTEVRRAQAKGVADVAIDPRSQNVIEEVLKLTDGKGVDVTFDVAGVKLGLEAALSSLKYGGTHVNIALWSAMEV
jgi:threonine dehydrogenase-like Zn-dependent dehydrogenase